MLPDKTFDITMLLGPMYHLYTIEDKIQAMSEAVRVTKPGGYIFVAYCMNEPTIIQYAFLGGHLKEVIEKYIWIILWMLQNLLSMQKK